MSSSWGVHSRGCCSPGVRLEWGFVAERLASRNGPMEIRPTNGPVADPCEVRPEFSRARQRLTGFLVALGLVLITFAAYGRIWIDDYQFLNADDGPYVTENPHVRAGLTRSGLWWALTNFHASNWHPLTSISLQLDCQLYGLNPY